MSRRSKTPRATLRELRKTGTVRGKRGKMSHREIEQARLVREMVNARWMETVKVQEQAPDKNVLRWVLGAGAFWVLIAGVIYAYSR